MPASEPSVRHATAVATELLRLASGADESAAVPAVNARFVLAAPPALSAVAVEMQPTNVEHVCAKNARDVACAPAR
jgi:hypothetical protein